VTEIQRRGGPQFSALLRRFGITSPHPGVEVVHEVNAVAPIPRLDNLCVGTADIPSNAARSAVQLFNPVGSGVIVILHRVWMAVSGATSVTLRVHNTALADAVGNLQVMSRTLGNQPSPSCQMWSAEAASVGTVAMKFDLDIADRTYEWDLGRVGDDQEFAGPSLAEGRGILMVPGANTTAFNAGYYWTERLHTL